MLEYEIMYSPQTLMDPSQIVYYLYGLSQLFSLRENTNTRLEIHCTAPNNTLGFAGRKTVRYVTISIVSKVIKDVFWMLLLLLLLIPETYSFLLFLLFTLFHIFVVYKFLPWEPQNSKMAARGPKMANGGWKRCTPRFLGPPVNFPFLFLLWEK